MISTNTFLSTCIAMADYEMEDYVYELNYEGAHLARESCDEVTVKDPSKSRFVVGAIGPTNCTGSISPSVADPTSRNVIFDELVGAYLEQTVALVDGRSDILMVETIFDTLNAKVALFAVGEYLEFAKKTLFSSAMSSGDSSYPPTAFGKPPLEYTCKKHPTTPVSLPAKGVVCLGPRAQFKPTPIGVACRMDP